MNNNILNTEDLVGHSGEHSQKHNIRCMMTKHSLAKAAIPNSLRQCDTSRPFSLCISYHIPRIVVGGGGIDRNSL